MSAFMLGTSAVLAVYRGAQRVWEWTGAALFPRFWSGPLDPTGLRLFLDAAGATQATAAGQPIGKVARAAGTVDASQATALSRPTLARWPKGGRRNLLTWTEEFVNAAWSKNVGGGLGTVTDNALTVNGVTYARQQATVGGSGLAQSFPVTPGQVLTLSVRLIGDNGDIILGLDGAMASAVLVPSSAAGELRTITATVPDGVTSMVFRTQNSIGLGSFFISQPQVEIGPETTPYQRVASANDVTETSVPDVWHLWNDGGDSLPAILPAGAYEIAWVTPIGAINYASVTSDGTTGTELLRAERMADVLAREGTFTPVEKTALEFYWQQRYAA